MKSPQQGTSPAACRFHFGLNSCRLIPGSAPCQPNATGSLTTSLSKFVPGTGWTFYQSQYDNTTQQFSNGFSAPVLDEIGNVRRNTYFGPHFWNTDLSLQKSFSIWEHVETKFRMDAVKRVQPHQPR